MPRTTARLVVPSLIAACAFCPVARADDAGPTVFQRAIRSWMGVVTLLAAEGEREGKPGGDVERARHDSEHANRAPSMRSDRGGRGGRGPREWSRGRGPGPFGPGMRMQAPRPGGPPMHGMHGMPGMPPMGAGSTAKLDEIAERLARIERKLDATPRMGNPWSPRPEAGSRPGPAGPVVGREREMPEEMRDRIKGAMEEGRTRMAEAQEKMEQARRRFAEMEERIKKLEAEVERLKAGK